jgi:hypothetical protein
MVELLENNTSRLQNCVGKKIEKAQSRNEGIIRLPP